MGVVAQMGVWGVHLSPLLKQPWRLIRRAALHHQEKLGDRRIGVDTAVRSFNAPADPVRSPYEPVHYEALRTIDDHVPLSPDEVVYDLGCGKGRVICHFAAKPIRKVVGVEYEADLAQVAKANLDNLAGRLAEGLVITGDAGAQDLSDATLLFMFNPFGSDTMRAVLRRASGRPGLRIVYAGPVHEAVFSEFPALRVVDRFTVPYDLGRMAVVVWRHD